MLLNHLVEVGQVGDCLDVWIIAKVADADWVGCSSGILEIVSLDPSRHSHRRGRRPFLDQLPVADSVRDRARQLGCYSAKSIGDCCKLDFVLSGWNYKPDSLLVVPFLGICSLHVLPDETTERASIAGFSVSNDLVISWMQL